MVKTYEICQIVEQTFFFDYPFQIRKSCRSNLFWMFLKLFLFFFVNFLCWHFLNISQYSHWRLSLIWHKMLSHFLLFQMQFVEHQQKWLIMAFFHGFSSWKCFCLHSFASFLNILRHMPNTDLKVYSTLLFMHVTTDLLMLICG